MTLEPELPRASVDVTPRTDGDHEGGPEESSRESAEQRARELARTWPAEAREAAPAEDRDSVAKRLVKQALFPRRAQPVTFGRFTVLRQLGQGGMGVVYACYDEQLDRKVAVKGLHAEVVRAQKNAEARLIREAQAMARLSHANIVTVHEVGQTHGTVYVAMEFVDGRSLDEWLKEPRPWQAVVAEFVQAGRGLAAAHRAGIIHRDFKPQNVIVTDDGAVKVLDFGLARASDSPVREEWLESASDRGEPAGSHLMRSLTRTGVVLGTPAYMSPEQHLGEATTVASDQFSFCVSLYQGLYGALPFASRTYQALRADALRGNIAPAPPGSPVPSRIFKLLQRGLHPDPRERFASMEELLAGLEHDPRAKYRRLAGLAAAVSIPVAITAAALSGAEQCPDAHAELAGVWDPSRAEAARAALRAASPDHAEEMIALLEPQIEGYAEAWAQMRNDACHAHAEKRQSVQIFDLRTACLDQRRAALDAVVDAIVTADAAKLEHLGRAVASLPSLDRCADTSALLSAIPPPEDPEVLARVREHRDALARAEVLEQTAQLQRGLELVDAALTDEEAASYEPLRAEAHLRKGGLKMRDGDWSAALDAFNEALWTAIAVGHAPVAAQASSRRGYLLAYPLHQSAQARAELPMIAAFNRRVERDVELYGEFLLNAGTIHLQTRELDQARRSWEAARALLEQHDRLETPLGLNVLLNTAILLVEAEMVEEEVALRRRIVELSERLMGPRQAERATYEALLASALLRIGRPREALARMRGFQARAGGLESKKARFVATVMLAHTEMMAGSARSALRLMEEVQRAEPEEFGPIYWSWIMLAAAMDGDVAKMREAQAVVRAAVEEPASPGDVVFSRLLRPYAQALRVAGLAGESVAPLEKARAALAGSKDRHDVVTSARVSLDLGRARLPLGELDAAEVDLRAALATFEQELPPRHLDRAEVMSALGALALERRQLDEAREWLTSAEAIYAATAEPDYAPLVEARALLARATAERPRE